MMERYAHKYCSHLNQRRES